MGTLGAQRLLRGTDNASGGSGWEVAEERSRQSRVSTEQRWKLDPFGCPHRLVRGALLNNGPLKFVVSGRHLSKRLVECSPRLIGADQTLTAFQAIVDGVSI